jgi:hypothetical protein
MNLFFSAMRFSFSSQPDSWHFLMLLLLWFPHHLIVVLGCFSCSCCICATDDVSSLFYSALLTSLGTFWFNNK